jgi:hypothetical protein
MMPPPLLNREEGHSTVRRTVFRNSVQLEHLEELTFIGPSAD